MKTLFSMLFLTIVMIGCGVKSTISPVSPTDTPESNYAHGIISLQAGEFQKALRSFERAKGLNSEFAPAYEGIGLVRLEQYQLDRAEENFELSVAKDRTYAPAYVGLGRVNLARGKHGFARKEFSNAIELDPENVDAHYRKGESYFVEEQFDKARKWFRKTLNLDNTHVKADRNWKIADRIERAMPGTKFGKKLARENSLSRADLCLLMIEELKLDQIVGPKIDPKKKQEFSWLNPPTLTDIDGHHAEHYIRKSIDLGLMSLKPNGTFGPDEIVNRRDYALVVQGILKRFSGESATKFVGMTTAFPDLPSSNFAYNAAVLATTRGILSADAGTGNFRPLDPISGADALIGLRKMSTLLHH